MNPMLEKVALALGEAIVAKSLEPVGRSEIITAYDCRDLARAAVQALMEPDEAMVEAAYAVRVYGADLSDFEVEDCARPIWQAMLQTILEEK